jgi:hypothetical protein
MRSHRSPYPRKQFGKIADLLGEDFDAACDVALAARKYVANLRNLDGSTRTPQSDAVRELRTFARDGQPEPHLFSLMAVQALARAGIANPSTADPEDLARAALTAADSIAEPFKPLTKKRLNARAIFIRDLIEIYDAATATRLKYTKGAYDDSRPRGPLLDFVRISFLGLPGYRKRMSDPAISDYAIAEAIDNVIEGKNPPKTRL